MESEHVDILNVIFHGAILLVKIFIAGFLIRLIKSEATPSNKRILIYSPNMFFLAIFTVIYIYCEVYFLYNFYKGLDLYFYELIAMLDQLYLSVLVLLNLNKGEVSNGKS